MAQILFLGPDKDRGVGVCSLLRKEGHRVTWVRAVGEWRQRERETGPEIVVAAVAEAEPVLVRAGRTRGFATPVLLVQQETDVLGEIDVEDRIVDRITSPFLGEELLARVDALVRVFRCVRGTPIDTARSGVAGRFSNWLRSRLPRQEKPAAPYLEVAARVADWTDRRDGFDPGHAGRVTSFCAMIAEGLDLGEEETGHLLRAAMLHDIGKVAMPVEVLRKPAPLEDGQLRLLRTHPARGAALLRALDPDDAAAARVVLFHHERPDGAGYYGKSTDGVPRAAWVLAVAEAYDAMTSSRLRERLSPAGALAYLEERKGQAYDADCVDALADLLTPRLRALPLSRSPGR